MVQVTLDSNARSHLPDLSERVQFLDEEGRPIGYFVPEKERLRSLYEWARGAFTDEELAAARQEEGGFSLQEVMAELAS